MAGNKPLNVGPLREAGDKVGAKRQGPQFSSANEREPVMVIEQESSGFGCTSNLCIRGGGKG